MRSRAQRMMARRRHLAEVRGREAREADYDCEGGSGDGPAYTGTVTVVGEDRYGLDADGDGIGCEVE